MTSILYGRQPPKKRPKVAILRVKRSCHIRQLALQGKTSKIILALKSIPHIISCHISTIHYPLIHPLLMDANLRKPGLHVADLDFRFGGIH
jgi:hypothetical protein